MAQKTYLGIGDETTTYSKTLSSSDFQQGYYLFASGQTGGESSPNYYRSTNFHSVSYPNAVTVTTEYTLNTDSGFIWYDSNYSYLGSAGSDATPIVSGSSFTAIPPSNAAYCKFNINKTNIVSTGVGSVVVNVHSAARKVKNIYVGVNGVAKNVIKCYIGDANGKAQLCFDNSISELEVVYSVGTVSYTVPTWANYAVITGCGGGGGGSGEPYNSSSQGNGGGGGGAAVKDSVYDVSAYKGQTISITVGAGGSRGPSGYAGASSTYVNGGDGGDTVIGSILTLAGGKGGAKTTGGAAGGTGGGAGGNGNTNGSAGLVGSGGTKGASDYGEYDYYGGGGGGGSLGYGGTGGDADASGGHKTTNGGSGYHGGGGGGAGSAYSAGDMKAGGNGGDGYLKIIWKKAI